MKMPTHAMVLAAGLGLRMRPLTETLPKPLIEVAGRSMLDRALDHLDHARIDRKIVNIHWLGEMIVGHLASRGDVIISNESDLLLETGGGVKKALPLLGPDPFFVLNADIVWTDGPSPSLRRLAEMWDEAQMDALLLVQPTARAFGYDGVGDYFMDHDGRLRYRKEGEVTPILFSGVQLLHPRLFEGSPDGPFSLKLLYDRAEAKGRLFGIVHDGGWYHIGTPSALAEATVHLAAEPSAS